MSFKNILAALLLGFTLASASPRPGDVVLSLPYAAKAVAPFLLLPTALDDGDDVLKVNLLLLGAFTVPNSLALYHSWSGHGDQTAVWRKVVLAVDAATTVGMAGYAIHGLATLDKDGGNGYEGLGMSMLLLASIPVGLITLFDLIPFSAESGRFAAGPLLIPGETGLETGTYAAAHFDF